MAPPPKRALLSVSNKQDIKIIARGLVELGYEIISTSGTARLLNEHGIPVTDVSSVTGYPELMNGLVKTLHPIIHAGILANNDIEVVVVNLYPAETAMDIGGHAMLRAAVKNRSHVLTLVDPDDYNEALFNLADFTGLDETFMSDMAVKALQHTMKHDASILEMISSPTSLRYGENPHQTASINHVFQTSHGKSLSYCNYLDVDAALTCVAQFSAPTVAVVKHCSPCGLASGVTLRTAMLGALLGDPLSSFGSVVACNVPLTKKATEELVNSSKFIEVVVAPEIRQDVREILTTRPHWKKNVRLIESPPPSQWSTTTTRSTVGGMLTQIRDFVHDRELDNVRVVTLLKPDDEERKQLLFAWKAVFGVRSNGIVLCQDYSLIGMGAGQPSRVDAVRLAIQKAGKRINDSTVLASDGFFSFPDAIELASKAGIRCVIQPGGSRRDQEIIETANALGMVMLFTGIRHFKH